MEGKNTSLLEGTRVFLSLNPKRTSLAVSTQTEFANKEHKSLVNKEASCRIYTRWRCSSFPSNVTETIKLAQTYYYFLLPL